MLAEYPTNGRISPCVLLCLPSATPHLKANVSGKNNDTKESFLTEFTTTTNVRNRINSTISFANCEHARAEAWVNGNGKSAISYKKFNDEHFLFRVVNLVRTILDCRRCSIKLRIPMPDYEHRDFCAVLALIPHLVCEELARIQTLEVCLPPDLQTPLLRRSGKIVRRDCTRGCKARHGHEELILVGAAARDGKGANEGVSETRFSGTGGEVVDVKLIFDLGIALTHFSRIRGKKR